jgi:hypothetical protein
MKHRDVDGEPRLLGQLTTSEINLPEAARSDGGEMVSAAPLSFGFLL